MSFRPIRLPHFGERGQINVGWPSQVPLFTGFLRMTRHITGCVVIHSGLLRMALGDAWIHWLASLSYTGSDWRVLSLCFNILSILVMA